MTFASLSRVCFLPSSSLNILLCPPNLLLFRVSHAMRVHQTFVSAFFFWSWSFLYDFRGLHGPCCFLQEFSGFFLCPFSCRQASYAAGYDFVCNVSFLDVSSSFDTHLLLILALYLLLMWCLPLMRYLLSYPLWLDSNRF